MVKVNCKELRAGDTIHFRCGGSCVVDIVAKSYLYEKGFFINFVGTTHGINVNKAGRWLSRDSIGTVRNCPFDIIKITKGEAKP